LETNLRSQHDIELNTFIENFQESYPQVSKPSVEILNLNKVLENLIRQKELINKLNNLQISLLYFTIVMLIVI
jgi:hypothetical protein